MSTDDVLAKARQAKEAGASRFCMGAAWPSPKDRDIPKVAEMIREVKALGLATCPTLRMLSGDQAGALPAAGPGSSNHHTDTDPKFSAHIHHTPQQQAPLSTPAPRPAPRAQPRRRRTAR